MTRNMKEATKNFITITLLLALVVSVGGALSGREVGINLSPNFAFAEGDFGFGMSIFDAGGDTSFSSGITDAGGDTSFSSGITDAGGDTFFSSGITDAGGDTSFSSGITDAGGDISVVDGGDNTALLAAEGSGPGITIGGSVGGSGGGGGGGGFVSVIPPVVPPAVPPMVPPVVPPVVPPGGGDGSFSNSNGGGGSSATRCVLAISDRNISGGESISLSWNNNRVTDFILTDAEGNTLINTNTTNAYSVDRGTLTMNPRESTTYTLTATRGSLTRICEVPLTIGGITLSSVPYTGFDARDMLLYTFYGSVLAWVGAMGYVLHTRRRTPLVVKK